MLMRQTLFTFTQVPRIGSVERIHGISSRFYIVRCFIFYFDISKALFKLRNISRQKAGLLFNGVETNF